MANQLKDDLKTKTIYVLRHGETELNKKGMVQGRGVNASLNETGRLQAQATFEALKHEPIKTIFTSSLNRSIETIELWKNGEIEVLSHDGFDEISWGNQEGKEASYEAKNLYAETVKGWQAGNLDLNVGGGESPNQVMNRQKEAMQYVFEHGKDQILICMHGRAMRVLLCWLLGYPLNYMDGFPHHNCSYYKLNQKGAVFSLEEFNQTEHLTF